MSHKSIRAVLTASFIVYPLAITPTLAGAEDGPARSRAEVVLASSDTVVDANAQFQLAILGLTGKLGENGRRDAIKRLHMAADKGHNAAAFALGTFYSRGNHVKADKAVAAKLFRAAADRGDPQSQNALAGLLLKGSGVRQSNAEAIKYFKKAAQSGSSAAKVNLGILYIRGIGFRPNQYRGAMMIREAAEAGFKGGQFNLGVLLEAGIGIGADLTAAADWYGKAAIQGSNQAQYNLALLKLRSDAGKVDPVSSLKWLFIASQGNDPSTREKARSASIKLAERLSKKQISEAGKIATDWIKRQKKTTTIAADSGER